MAKGKYLSSDFRTLIAAEQSGSGTWPIEVSAKIGRSYGAVLTLLGRINDANLSLARIGEAMDSGVTPETHGSLMDFLSAVRRATERAIETPIGMPFADDALTQLYTEVGQINDTLARIERKVNAILIGQEDSPGKYDDPEPRDASSGDVTNFDSLPQMQWVKSHPFPDYDERGDPVDEGEMRTHG